MTTVEDEPLENIGWTKAPTDRPYTPLDVRGLGPPAPLQRTLETLTELDTRTILIQFNDRAPQHLYPQLDDRGYSYETVETEGMTVTAIWRSDS
ncbi:MAG: DUF2249 domain-containing protein [Halobacteriales archaeon]|nr:DUF2249 domain-containing protein [Halobacteriales archaeon]